MPKGVAEEVVEEAPNGVPELAPNIPPVEVVVLAEPNNPPVEVPELPNNPVVVEEEFGAVEPNIPVLAGAALEVPNKFEL